MVDLFDIFLIAIAIWINYNIGRRDKSKYGFLSLKYSNKTDRRRRIKVSIGISVVVLLIIFLLKYFPHLRIQIPRTLPLVGYGAILVFIIFVIYQASR